MATPGTGKTKAATKAAPDYGLRLLKDIEELPPEPARTHSVTYSEINSNLEKLQATPNVWAEVAHYAARPGSDKNPSGAKKVVAKFINGEIKPPPAGEDGGAYDIEWRSAKYDGSDRVGSVVLAKYVVT